jgi:hypothetical protein
MYFLKGKVTNIVADFRSNVNFSEQKKEPPGKTMGSSYAGTTRCFSHNTQARSANCPKAPLCKGGWIFAKQKDWGIVLSSGDHQLSA